MKKSSLKKDCIIILVEILVISLVAAPFIMQAIQKYSHPYNQISGGDILVYFGSLLGAIATTCAVLLTIYFTRNQQKAERKLSIKPFLQSSYYPLSNDDTKNTVKKYKTIYISCSNDEINIGISHELPDVFRKDDTSINIFGQTFLSLQEKKEHHYLIYILENVGAGNAISIEFYINGHIVDTPFAITTNSCKCFILVLSGKIAAKGRKDITFTFKYNDVASFGRYIQKEIITFYAENDGILNTSQSPINTLCVPCEIPINS